MTFETRGWIEHDYNPFILFSSSGEMTYTNASAELLLSYVEKKVFHDLALAYAPQDFGYKTTFMNLEYDKFNFYAITVGYEDEENIGLKLYQNPLTGSGRGTDSKISKESSNIYVLIDLCISLASANSDSLFKKEFDPTIPEFKLSQNEFTKVLRKVYDSFASSATITTGLKLKIGESVKIGNKRFQLLELSVKGEQKENTLDANIQEITDNINIKVRLAKNSVILEIPIIK